MTSADIIDRLGGTVAVAKLCRVSPQAVTQWKRDGIPDAREMYLRLARPQAFKETASKQKVAG